MARERPTLGSVILNAVLPPDQTIRQVLWPRLRWSPPLASAVPRRKKKRPFERPWNPLDHVARSREAVDELGFLRARMKFLRNSRGAASRFHATRPRHHRTMTPQNHIMRRSLGTGCRDLPRGTRRSSVSR